MAKLRPPHKEAWMDAKEIKARIKWFHEEVYNKGNLAVIEEFYAPNYSGMDMLTGQKAGLEDMKQTLAQGKAMYSAVHISIEGIVVEGNRAAFRHVGTLKDLQGKVLNWAVLPCTPSWTARLLKTISSAGR